MGVDSLRWGNPRETPAILENLASKTLRLSVIPLRSYLGGFKTRSGIPPVSRYLRCAVVKDHSFRSPRSSRGLLACGLSALADRRSHRSSRIPVNFVDGNLDACVGAAKLMRDAPLQFLFLCNKPGRAKNRKPLRRKGFSEWVTNLSSIVEPKSLRRRAAGVWCSG